MNELDALMDKSNKLTMAPVPCNSTFSTHLNRLDQPFVDSEYKGTLAEVVEKAEELKSELLLCIFSLLHNTYTSGAHFVDVSSSSSSSSMRSSPACLTLDRTLRISVMRLSSAHTSLDKKHMRAGGAAALHDTAP